ncbi:Cellulose synthase catalytic subunit [UDP-forming] OS=Castellaniella defragrans OX=75697 GN=HNR28_001348 PE=4 SV=1 [Castellaniella defragrans]
MAIFDCDHIPVRSFLQLSVGLFLKDPKLALVQLPHHFFSPDPFERNLRHFGTQPNENALFYGLVQDGNDLWNAAFFCGSCAVLRRSALEAVGGVTVETVTEDAHTALRLHRAGFNSAYLQVPQAAGLATESLSAHVGQRIRWARGMIQIFRLDNPLFGKGLGFFQRLCYFNAMLHFLSGVPRLIYLISPLAFLLFHSYIVYAPGVAILLNVVPHLLHANLTNSRVQGSWRRTLWGEIYETVLSWYIARPTTVALLAPHQGKFNVTAKGGLVERRFYDWSISSPYVVLALANVVGLGFGVWRLVAGPADEIVTVLITLVWVLFNLVILGGAIAVAEELRQVRRNPRVPVSLPAHLQFQDGRVLSARVADYASEGIGARLSLARRIPLHARVNVCLSVGASEFAFPARVIRCEGTDLGIRLAPMDRAREIEFVQCTFGRADAWVSWQSRFQADQPVRSVLGILKLGVQGYGRMLCAAPAPISTVRRFGQASAAWVGSFIPLLERPALGAGPVVLESAHESAPARLSL